MKPIDLAARIIAVAFAVVAAVLFSHGRDRLEEKQAEVDFLDQALQARQAEVEAATGDLAAAEESLRIERETLTGARREREAARSEMLAARQELERTRLELERARGEVVSLEDTVTSLRLELVEGERRVTEASGSTEVSRLQERISELEMENTRLRLSANPSP